MEFLDDFYDETLIEEKRTACRGIIFKENKVILIYCGYFNDYSFPGGGLEEGEELETCLIRELREEVGAIVSNIKLFDFVDEKRRHFYKIGHNFTQRSYYFTCDLVEETEQKLEDYEIEFGYEKTYVDLEDAITHNMKVLEMIEKYRDKYLKKINYEITEESLETIRRFGAPTAVKRELYILNLLKEKRNERL